MEGQIIIRRHSMSITRLVNKQRGTDSFWCERSLILPD
jgi:hypothetical protein